MNAGPCRNNHSATAFDLTALQREDGWIDGKDNRKETREGKDRATNNQTICYLCFIGREV